MPGSQHPTHLPERRGAIREEHRPELADDRIEARVLERQLQRIRLAPLDGARGSHP